MLRLDMSSVQPSLAGPKRPQDKVLLSELDTEFLKDLKTEFDQNGDASKRHLVPGTDHDLRSEEHTSELQSLMRISYAVFCLKKKNKLIYTTPDRTADQQ